MTSWRDEKWKLCDQRTLELIKSAKQGDFEHREGTVDPSPKDVTEAFCGEGTCGTGLVDGKKLKDLSSDEATAVVDHLKDTDPSKIDLWIRTTDGFISEKEEKLVALQAKRDLLEKAKK